MSEIRDLYASINDFKWPIVRHKLPQTYNHKQ